ncbi:MAG: ribonuclease, partial [Pseudonocardiales bacterium]|nr:ribonuclease [Pseudonocardiales bacterium]
MLDHTPDNHDNPAGDSAEPAAAPAAKAVRRAAAKAPAKRAPRKAAAKKAAPAADQPPVSDQPAAASPLVNDLPAAPDQPADQPTVAGSPEPVAVPAKKVARTRKAPAKKATKAAGPAATTEPSAAPEAAPAEQAPAPASQPAAAETLLPAETGETGAGAAEAAPSRPPAKRTPRKRVSKAAAEQAVADRTDADRTGADRTDADQTITEQTDQPAAEFPAAPAAPVLAAPVVLFQPPAAEPAPRRRRGAKRTAPEPEVAVVPAEEDTLDELPGLIDPDADLEPEDVDTDDLGTEEPDTDEADDTAEEADSDDTAGEGTRRRRRRGRRGRGNRSADNGAETDPAAEAPTELGEDDDEPDDDHADEVAEAALSASARRRRRRRRSSGADGEAAPSEDDPPNTVVHVRDSRSANRDGRGGAADDDGVRGVKGSTRLEAKRQRRRDNRDTGRRRAPILTEAEFLARREAVDRVMAVRQTGDRTQIAVLEDDILVEHYVTRASASSAGGNVYLGRVQNVLPSMEAAIVDIGRGRNGVLYAGEVNWDTAGLEGKSRSIENALSAGDLVLVQVTKDPIGHKGARLTSQISLPGRFVVYVPGGGMTGISRKLPDVERSRLKAILKKVVPDEAGVIVRTAAEGASEQDLVSDVERLKSEWESISAKAARAKQSSDGPSLLHGEPDLAIRVVRDIFNDDFSKLVVAGAEIYRTIGDYVRDIAPDLADRISRHTAESDLFRDLRVDEQLAKALDRKVWLPSGGSLVIDRTEAMTVVDVNTGKYTGSGGNLEQTVTRNNLEAAEEIVRQLRLRDIGGIVVIDFIDMVLESNRDLVLRRLTECLGRDRTKHQVAEVTSLGLVQMTRKRVGEGLLEAFSESCSVCGGRGVIV